MTLLMNILEESYFVLYEAAPYLLLGLFIAGLLKSYISDNLLQKWMSGEGLGSTLRASFIGIPLPLCSCSVIPVAAQINKAGASKHATASFLVSTPQVGVDSFFLTIGLINPVFAVFRVVAAFFTAVVAGIVQIFSGRIIREDPAAGNTEDISSSCCSTKSCCSPVHKGEEKGNTGFIRGQRYAFGSLFPMIAPSLAFGVFLTGWLLTILPEGILEQYLDGGLGGMILVCLFSTMLYLCASGSTPLAASLIAKGMSPGTALVLLLAGPAVSLVSLFAIKNMLGLKRSILFILTIIVCAISAGLFLDFLTVYAGLSATDVSLVGDHERSSLIMHIVAFAFFIMMTWLMLLEIEKKVRGLLKR